MITKLTKLGQMEGEVLKKRDTRRMKSICRGIYAQIASEIGKSENAVRMAIRRGNWELQKRYAEILKERLSVRDEFQKLLKEVA